MHGQVQERTPLPGASAVRHDVALQALSRARQRIRDSADGAGQAAADPIDGRRVSREEERRLLDAALHKMNDGVHMTLRMMYTTRASPSDMRGAQAEFAPEVSPGDRGSPPSPACGLRRDILRLKVC